MSDKPFKMQGHTLPGPNQRSALKMTYRDAIVGNVSGKHLSNTLFGGGMKRQQDTQVGEDYYSAIKAAENTQPYVDSGIDDSGTNTLDTMGDDTTKKKKVDVEVTVNGEPV